MIEAAPLLEGEHDFTAFAAADEKDALGHSKVRRIFSSKLTREGDRLIYRVTGSGFLKHMVRNIVGTAIYLYQNEHKPDEMTRILAAKDRQIAKNTARPEGLRLESVEYPRDLDIRCREI